MHLENRKYGDFVFISRLTDKFYATQFFYTFAALVYRHVYKPYGHIKKSK